MHASLSWLRVEERHTALLLFIRNIVLEIRNCLHSQLTHSSDTHKYPTRHATQGSFHSPEIQNKFKKAYSVIKSPYCMELPSISYCSNKQQTWFKKLLKQHLMAQRLSPIGPRKFVYALICRLQHVPLKNVCSSVLELFLSIDVLYYVILCFVLCGPQKE